MEQYQWNFWSACQKITDDIDGAESARQKAEELAGKREELAGSRKEAASIVENAKETAEKNKSQILSEATQEAVRLKEKKRNQKLRITKRSIEQYQGDVADLTVNLASKLLSQELDAEGQRQLIDRYLDELGKPNGQKSNWWWLRNKPSLLFNGLWKGTRLVLKNWPKSRGFLRNWTC